jgi:hypothetical protein
MIATTIDASSEAPFPGTVLALGQEAILWTGGSTQPHDSGIPGLLEQASQIDSLPQLLLIDREGVR